MGRVREKEETCGSVDKGKPWRHWLIRIYEEVQAIQGKRLTYSETKVVTCEKRLQHLLKISNHCPKPDCQDAGGSDTNTPGFFRKDSLKQGSERFELEEDDEYCDWFDKAICQLFDINSEDGGRQ